VTDKTSPQQIGNKFVPGKQFNCPSRHISWQLDALDIKVEKEIEGFSLMFVLVISDC